MSNTLILIVVLVAVAVLIVIAMTRKRDITTEAGSLVIQLDPIVGGFVDAVHHCASEAEDCYVNALARLRQDPEHTARQIEIAYRSVGSEQIGVRKSLLLTANALAHRSVLPLLSEVARQPVSGTVRHDGGRAAEESIVKMMAVDGIDAIARSGDTDAADILLALAASPDRGVQTAAVVALKYADIHHAHYEKLQGVLSPDRLYLLDIVRANVRDVHQITDPRRHLHSEPTTVDARPDPASGERRNVGPTSHQSRVPRAPVGG